MDAHDPEQFNLHSAEDFQQYYSTRTWNWYEPLLQACRAYGLQEPVLDLGCGLGLFVECCKHQGLQCTGLEGSEYGVQQALARCPELDVRQHYLHEPLPFSDESIGTVVLHQVIEHIEPATARAVLEESYRILVAGGRLFVFSPSRYNPEEREESTHINLYTPKQLFAEVRNAGFSHVQSLNTIKTFGGIPIYLLGHSHWGKWFMRAFYRYFPLDFISASANCMAIKKDL